MASAAIWLVAVVLGIAALFVPSVPAAEGVRVYVTSNGWHSGIAVARADLPDGVLPEADDFPQAAFLEFGWGDAEYYPARDPGLGAALGAAFGSSAAVVHLAGLPAHPRQVFPASETLDLILPKTGFAALTAYLHATFVRQDGNRASPVSPGLYAFSRFYPATGQFSMVNTCNTWTAAALSAAGLPVEPDGVVRAEALMAQLRPLSIPPAGNQ